MRAELAAAFMLLTRFPMPASAAPPPIERCLWAYPLVGAVVGGVGAATYAVLSWAGMSPALAAAWALAAAVLATGALHEDGLADMADGFGGGTSRARKLEIMRDSRVGSYGVLALVLAASIRIAAVSELAAPGRVAPALIVAGALSRGTMAIPLLMLGPARADGLAAGLRERQPGRAAFAPLLGAAVAAMLLPGGPAAASVLAGFGAAAALGLLASRQIGGYTGDVLGATAVTAECAAVSAVAAVWAG